MHVYVGWTCKTPGCGEEIEFKYLGAAPLADKIEITMPSVLMVQCRKCRKVHDYSHSRPENFLRPNPPTADPKSN
jgi:hypothetical protein